MTTLTPGKLAYSLAAAAETTDISIDVLRRAIRSGDLVASYPTSKPVILASELQAWLDSLATAAPGRTA